MTAAFWQLRWSQPIPCNECLHNRSCADAPIPFAPVQRSEECRWSLSPVLEFSNLWIVWERSKICCRHLCRQCWVCAASFVRPTLQSLSGCSFGTRRTKFAARTNAANGSIWQCLRWTVPDWRHLVAVTDFPNHANVLQSHPKCRISQNWNRSKFVSTAHGTRWTWAVRRWFVPNGLERCEW